MQASSYLHITSGRLRVRVPAVKGSKGVSVALEQELRRIPGIVSVSANPVTANVLVLFDGTTIDASSILLRIEAQGYLPALPSPRSSQTAASTLPIGAWSSAITKSLLAAVAEVVVQTAVRRVITALI